MVMLIPKNVIKGGYMRELKKDEMLKVEGGTDLTSSMLTAIYKTFELIYSIGESLGSYIRRKTSGKMCDI